MRPSAAGRPHRQRHTAFDLYSRVSAVAPGGGKREWAILVYISIFSCQCAKHSILKVRARVLDVRKTTDLPDIPLNSSDRERVCSRPRTQHTTPSTRLSTDSTFTLIPFCVYARLNGTHTTWNTTYTQTQCILYSAHSKVETRGQIAVPRGACQRIQRCARQRSQHACWPLPVDVLSALPAVL